MKFQRTKLFLAVLSFAAAPVAFAQATVVVPPPPVKPGTPVVAQAAAPAVAPVAPVDIAASAVASVDGAPVRAQASAAQAAAPGGGSIEDVMNLSMPRPPEPPSEALTPKVKGPAATPKKKPEQSVKRTTPPVERKAEVVDPFAGVVGTPVSDSQLNRFMFPEPVEGVYFAEGAPLPECAENAGPKDPCKPVFLNGKKLMLLQLRAGAKGPIQMMVHLKSGRVIDLNLAPAQGPGAVVRVDGADDGVSDSRLAAAKQAEQSIGLGQGPSAAESHVALLSKFASGAIPAGYAPEVTRAAVRFDTFDLIPLARWSNGGALKANLYKVQGFGETPVAVSSNMFQTDSVKALALDRNAVTKSQPALLYVLEQVEEE